MGSHNQGTECRTQRKGVDSGNGNGNRHCQTELRVERTCCTADKTYGDKHRHENECGGDKCGCDVAHRRDCGGIRRFDTFVELRLHRLDHHNGIVDHRTDDKHQCKQCQHVQAEAYDVEERKRTDKADDDGNRRNESGTETLQKYVDDEHNENDGLDERFHYVLDGSVEEVLGTHQVDKFHTFRKRFRYFFLFGINQFDDFIGV